MKLIVSEGDGDRAFFKNLIKIHKLVGFDIYEGKDGWADGNSAFAKALDAILIGTRYEDANLVIVVADCDSDPEKEFKNVQRQLRGSLQYAVPERPREVASEVGKRSASILMLPWDDETGALETICYSLAVREWPQVAKCVTKFVECVGGNSLSPQKLAKLQLRGMIAGTCPYDPNTALQWAWSGGRRPDNLIPLKQRNKLLQRIIKYLKELP